MPFINITEEEANKYNLLYIPLVTEGAKLFAIN